MKHSADPGPIRFYRWALLVLPRRFRGQCGPAMVAMFADEWRERRGTRRGRLLTRALIDLVWTAVIERIRPLGGRLDGAMRTQRLRNRMRRGRIGFSWLDVKLGLRLLVKHPGLTLAGGAGISVAIAIGVVLYSAAAAAYTPLPLEEGDRVVAIENWDTRWNNQERQILHDFVSWREGLESIVDLGAWRPIVRNLIPGGAEPVEVAEMTASGFRLARVPPLLGRYFDEGDQREGAPPVLVIGHDLWRTRFASDSAVVGRQVRLGSTVHTVIGVMPEGFEFPMYHQLWVPLRADPGDYERRDGPGIFVFGRLAPGVTLEGAGAELATFGQLAAAAYPETHQRLRPRVMAYTLQLYDDATGWELPVGFFLVLLLLAEVCVNVGILVYARTATRYGEVAVRTALGASRRRIVTQLFAEALVLSGLAAAVGIVVAWWGLGRLDAVLDQLVDMPFWIDLGISPGTVVFAVGLAVLGAAIVGIVPALKATGRRVGVGLQRLAVGTSGMRLGGIWTALIVTQVGFAVAVVPMAIYSAREFLRYGTADPGFATEQFLTARLVMDSEIPPSAEAEAYYRERQSRYATLQSELMRRLEAEPAVSAVIPLEGVPGFSPGARIELESAVPGPAIRESERRAHVVGSRRVDTDYFDAFEVPLLAGRRFHSGDAGGAVTPRLLDADGDGHAEFAFTDGGEAPTTVIVNESFVQEVLGGRSALGTRVRYLSAADGEPGPWHEIIGVVGDFPANRMEPDLTQARLYHPMQPGQAFERFAMHVRGTDPTAFAARLRELVLEMDPSLRLTSILTLDEVLRSEQGAMRMGALAIALVTLSVLLLACAGIYALMSFTVTQRRRELGIRAALGAAPRRLLAGIFSRALGQLAIGILVGGAGALLLFVGEGLVDGGALNADKLLVLFAVSAFMLAVGLLATIEPARRGLRIHPTEALRAE